MDCGLQNYMRGGDLFYIANVSTRLQNTTHALAYFFVHIFFFTSGNRTRPCYFYFLSKIYDKLNFMSDRPICITDMSLQKCTLVVMP